MMSYISEAMPRAYAATYEGASLLVATDHGRVWMRDRNRAALLHRLSTNHIEALQPGQGTTTVLTTPIGRIIDLLTVYALDDALLLLSSPGRGAALSSHLRKNIFFNDRVKLEDAGSSLDQRALYGPQAPALLAQLGLPGAELGAHGVAVTTWHDQLLYVARTHAVGGNGYWLLAAPETMAQVADALREAGTQLLDAATYDVLRVEHGSPAYARELSQEYIPLETGLWDAVSFNKGCYVGQEIIARMESRGRLAKQLRGLRLAALPALPAEPAIPLAKLAAGDKEAGDLTSLVRSPRYGLIALGYVRTAYAAVGTRLEVAGVAAEVVELPFC
ncbi:YgfZ/GcvT domain-containing protein [Candidatus Chloroploca asiatica]|uniref:CAF17-like 4Fe-4S cluster assembly/insertion protein YgfZ n=1 Tax=Candidatus Chloroploca asiatica TaxID=1506545 RepID=UPI001FEC81E1|nr:glycine cleavage T C-terminal barrel domain-containing protein [Candidatus Chloroploca asiatica]